MSRALPWWVLAAVCALPGLMGGDEAAALLLWEHAVEESGGDLGHPLFIDATRESLRVRPWQPGAGDARRRVTRVGEVRRAAMRLR